MEYYRGSDWLSLSLGGFFLLIGLVLTVPASRYFHRRRGPAAAIGFSAAFWAAVILAALALNRGYMSWPSLVACCGCAVVAVGYSTYLAVWRRDLRVEPAGEQAEVKKPALRRCPACGLEVDSRPLRCPACGAGGEKETAG